MQAKLHSSVASWGYLIAVIIAGAPLAYADEVVVAAATRGQPPSRRTGQIIDYTGKGLVLRVPGGAETTIPAERVLEVHAQWSPAHLRGDELFTETKFAEALDQYRLAVGQEQRAWVRRRLASRAVWCYQNLGQHEYAASAFLTLSSQDATTPHFEAIPLSWTTAQPGPAFEDKLNNWLKGDDAIAALVASSWLLTTGQRREAAAKLQLLTRDADSRVALLAQAQLWRTQQATATIDEIARWRAAIERIPESLRAGPYFLAGQALARLGNGREAVLALMRVPVLYPQQRVLAAESLLAAGRELEKLQRRSEARQLFQELASVYSESPLADLARRRIEDAAP